MNSPNSMLVLNAFDPGAAQALKDTERAMVERRRKSFGDALPLFYQEPVHFVRASGVWLYDQEGQPYLDAYNNVPSVGHCHPHVVQAVAEQSARLNTHTRYLSEVVTRYAERLLATFPADLSNVLFTSTGTEGVDLAMRIARYHTGASGFIVTRFAYHGHSSAVAEITPAFGPGVALGAHVRTVPAPDGYRGDPDVGATFARHVEEAIADLDRHGFGFAGLVLDSICSSDGLFVDPPGFLQATADVVRRAGGLYIADEVQPGFGRMGSGMWGFARHGFVPDIVVTGKPMGNGMPIAAVIARPDVMESFARQSGYFNTFGGNTVCCAAAAAVLDVIEQEQLIGRAARVGQHLKQGFEKLMCNFDGIGDVRGAGLYLGVDCVKPGTRAPDTELALRLINELRRRRILISTCGPAGNVLKIRPPLQFDIEHCDLLLDNVAEILTSG